MSETVDNGVIAVYDIRGIQKYIYNTNTIKEIIGASVIVENIIIDGLRHVIEQNNYDKKYYLTDWETKKEEIDFLVNKDIIMQVMYIGGGNAYVLYRSEKECKEVNRNLARYVLEATYSLSLAVAYVDKSENYREDFVRLSERMSNIKVFMPLTKPVGVLPMIYRDTVTGYPLTYYDEQSRDYICTESKLKREAYNRNRVKDIPREQTRVEEGETIFDNMVTMKGQESLLAIVHIDGNSMGKRIGALMKNRTDYQDAIQAMRQVSANIKHAFNQAFDAMGKKIDECTEKIKPDFKGKLYRRIITAGDDITFICNAKVAISAVECFMKEISDYRKYQIWKDPEKSGVMDVKEYAFSACAGIAFFHSHFPFRDAYQVAEECCGEAKKIAKIAKNRNNGEEDGLIGAFLDYEFCTNVNAADLTGYREKNYRTADGNGFLIRRPYYIDTELGNKGIEAGKVTSDLNERNSGYSINRLKKTMDVFCEKKDKEIPRSMLMDLRNLYYQGEEAVNQYMTFLQSRSYSLEETGFQKGFCDGVGSWYDALELMDLYYDIQS